jgi:hypothetical protein
MLPYSLFYFALFYTLSRVGQNHIYTVHDLIASDFPAKKYRVYTVHVCMVLANPTYVGSGSHCLPSIFRFLQCTEFTQYSVLE